MIGTKPGIAIINFLPGQSHPTGHTIWKSVSCRLASDTFFRRTRVVCIDGNQGIAARRCRGGQRGCGICENAVAEFEHVGSRREVVHGILTEIGPEQEGIATRAAGHRVVTRAAGDGVIPGRARRSYRYRWCRVSPHWR